MPTPVRTPKLLISHHTKAPTSPAAPVPDAKYLRRIIDITVIQRNSYSLTRHCGRRQKVEYKLLTVAEMSALRGLKSWPVRSEEGTETA